MASTVVFFLFSRYRLPAVPALLLLAGVPLVAALRGLAESAAWRAIGAALAMAAFAPSPISIGFEPRMDLVHYNLGRLADERGDADGGTGALPRGLRARSAGLPRLPEPGQPRRPPARLGHGPPLLPARRGPRAAARTTSRATSAASTWRSAISPQAEAHLDRALTLNPRNLSALQNGALLRMREGDPDGARELVRRILEIDPRNPAALRLRERLGQRR